MNRAGFVCTEEVRVGFSLVFVRVNRPSETGAFRAEWTQGGITFEQFGDTHEIAVHYARAAIRRIDAASLRAVSP